MEADHITTWSKGGKSTKETAKCYVLGIIGWREINDK